jgi:hypothetical protein
VSTSEPIDIAKYDYIAKAEAYKCFKKQSGYYRIKVELEDLEQIARLGIFRASQTYDPSHGATFATYAWHFARGSIFRYLRDFVFHHISKDRKESSPNASKWWLEPNAVFSLEAMTMASENEEDGSTVPFDLPVTEPGYLQAEIMADAALLDRDHPNGTHKGGGLPEVVRQTMLQGSQAAAAKALGISQMQVSRRIRRLRKVVTGLETCPVKVNGVPCGKVFETARGVRLHASKVHSVTLDEALNPVSNGTAAPAPTTATRAEPDDLPITLKKDQMPLRAMIDALKVKRGRIDAAIAALEALDGIV